MFFYRHKNFCLVTQNYTSTGTQTNEANDDIIKVDRQSHNIVEIKESALEHELQKCGQHYKKNDYMHQMTIMIKDYYNNKNDVWSVFFLISKFNNKKSQIPWVWKSH